LYLGVDGGGSGCRAAVGDGQGRVLGRGSAGSANIWTGFERARDNILAAVAAALAEAGAAGRDGEVRAVLGLAGANVSGAASRLAAVLPFARARIESDAVIALRGALGTADGVTAALGTGSVFGVQRKGAIRMIGGWGHLLGDQASGARLGRALCEAALLAHDGLAPGSPLLAAVIAEAGGPAGLVVWGAGAVPADFAALVPRLVGAAAAGDAAAEAILGEAEASVAGAVDVLRGGEALPVCFLGGLGPVFARRLAARYGAMIREPAGTGLDGALAMARELA
jgi:glucosamine kinase